MKTPPTRAQLQALLDEHWPESGVVIEELGPRQACLRLPVTDRHLRPGGTVSGPAQMELADAAMYIALLSEIGLVLAAVTVSLHIDFLRRPDAGDLRAVARLLKVGSTLAIGEVQLRSIHREAPVARATVTCFVPAGAGAD